MQVTPRNEDFRSFFPFPVSSSPSSMISCCRVRKVTRHFAERQLNETDSSPTSTLTKCCLTHLTWVIARDLRLRSLSRLSLSLSLGTLLTPCKHCSGCRCASGAASHPTTIFTCLSSICWVQYDVSARIIKSLPSHIYQHWTVFFRGPDRSVRFNRSV